MFDGAQAAFVIRHVDDVERLLRAGRQAGATRWASVTVMALPAWTPFTCAFAPLSRMTTPEQLHQVLVGDAALVARQAMVALPPDVAGRYVVYERWRSPSLLASLRQGAFDALLLATWPPLWPQRASLVRAAREGGTAILRVTESRRRARRCSGVTVLRPERRVAV